MRLRLPHPVLLLQAGIALGALLTWILPAGEFDRRDDPATGRRVVVAGTYRTVQPAPVSPLGAVVAVPRGLVEGADVLVSILFVGGAFALVDRLGTLRRAAGALVRRFQGRGLWAIPVVTLVFATFGALENMQEEIVALVPVLLVLGRGLGVDALTVVAMSAGGAILGAAYGPSNPFQAGIALKLAQMPLLSGAPLRLVMLAASLVLWTGWTMRHAGRNRVASAAGDAAAPDVGDLAPLDRRDAVVLTLLILPLAAYVVGVLTLDFGFNELSAFFFFAALAIGIISGLGASGSMSAYLQAMETMVAPAALVGFARSISVVMTDGRIIDTVVNGLASPLAGRPPEIAALLMIPVQGVIHLFVPSVSGQAALTMPILIPLADLIALSRQAVVLAFETGAGLSEALIPTNGALMAVLLAAGVPYTTWLRFAWRGLVLVLVVGVVGTMVAVGM